ncbi:nucleoside monophosphate kinase [Candidatus Gracilibacteria bacterium]|nr:nucleoside monophosphate kinase [Candidatus Gracilibacteria bacterium]MCF7898456.1 nucleoside monophosphate kinase [Candidatus Paceibacterota bacterium]
MEKQFFVLIGRSGSGKGTQSELLKNALESKGVERVVNVTTGAGFRDFITKDTYVAKLAREVNDTGGLQPEFLAVWGWSNIFINILQGGETIILDGAPRKPFEVHVLHSAINFFGYHKPIIIYLETTESVSREHIAKRGRADDKIESDVNNRMDWFETDVLPTLDVYFNDPRYTVLRINGNQTIDEVHNEIMQKLSI